MANFGKLKSRHPDSPDVNRCVIINFRLEGYQEPRNESLLGRPSTMFNHDVLAQVPTTITPSFQDALSLSLSFMLCTSMGNPLKGLPVNCQHVLEIVIFCDIADL